MKVIGTVRNGVVVVEGSVRLPEGAQVRVEFEESEAPGAWIDEFAGAVDDLPPDASRQVDHYLYGHKDQGSLHHRSSLRASRVYDSDEVTGDQDG